MKVLGIESSTITASCALIDDNKLVGEYTLSHKKTHSEKLMPMIEQLLEDTETVINDVDVIAISKGPGSYTGLRIGAAIAKSLAYACNKKIVSVPTIAGLAFNIHTIDGCIVPIIDARGGRIYSGMYRWEKDEFITIEEQFASDIDKLAYKLENIEGKIILSGDGAQIHEEYFREKLKNRVVFSLPYINMPKASSIAQLGYILAEKGNAINSFEFVPEYLRKTQAERSLEGRK